MRGIASNYIFCVDSSKTKMGTCYLRNLVELTKQKKETKNDHWIEDMTKTDVWIASAPKETFETSSFQRLPAVLGDCARLSDWFDTLQHATPKGSSNHPD